MKVFGLLIAFTLFFGSCSSKQLPMQKELEQIVQIEDNPELTDEEKATQLEEFKQKVTTYKWYTGLGEAFVFMGLMMLNW